MFHWWRKSKAQQPAPAEVRIRHKYAAFRELLALNNECLELMAGLQEDLQFVPPRRDVFDRRIAAIYEKAEGTVAALEKLTGAAWQQLREAVQAQREEIERHMAAFQELSRPRLSAWLTELGASSALEAGAKAAVLAEIKNKLRLPVPDGYVLTTEAYRQFCGIPLWRQIRDAVRGLDLNDLAAVRTVSERVAALVLSSPVPRAVEVAVTERAHTINPHGSGMAVRSSAVGEGAERTFAGQFLSILNVPQSGLVEAYKRVVAGRFGERALFYRLSTGLLEIETPMAVLFLPVLAARASGIMYTRDPGDPRSKLLWVTSTRGLGLDIASGGTPADHFVVSRNQPHPVIERSIVHKDESIALESGGGTVHRTLGAAEADAPSLEPDDLRRLADYGVLIEDHFRAPQDIEWVLDELGKLWIVQARPLALAGPARARSRVKAELLLAGGRPVYPGRVSGVAYLVETPAALRETPDGAVLFLRRASPEIVEVFPRISGLVAEWGNVAGHAAALLREFKIPSVFHMAGAFDRLAGGETVSLDAAQSRVYPGALWPPRSREVPLANGLGERDRDPLSRRLLALHLVDPAGSNFRPAGCRSTHDVLRFCHEKAIETMFAINDLERDRGPASTKRLTSEVPVNIYVLDLGGGLVLDSPEDRNVRPEQIVSRPFQALWGGLSHPDVTWQRGMPASLSDLASVMAGSFSAQGAATRALGEESYLLVADEYMNLNSRLAYHFSLVDSCLSDTPGNNYISFRFAGGGATRDRRNLRACFLEECLVFFGFRVDRRGDLVNAWLKKAPLEETAARLDTLGRLMACSSQLDMYMTSHEAMKWYVRQFLAGNYRFQPTEAAPRA
jgi:pyruvate,water dikinase